MKFFNRFRPPKVVIAFWSQFKGLLWGLAMATVMTFGLKGYAGYGMGYVNRVWNAELPAKAQEVFNTAPGRVTSFSGGAQLLVKQALTLSATAIGLITMSLIAGLGATAILAVKCFKALMAYGIKAARSAKNLARLYRFLCQRIHACAITQMS